MIISHISTYKWVVLLIVFLLAAITYAVTSTFDRFYVEESQLLRNGDFNEGSEFWRYNNKQAVRFAKTGVVLVNQTSERITVIQRVDPVTAGYYRLAFTAESKDIVADKVYSAGGSVAIVYLDANGERFNSAAGVFLYGTKGKKSYTGDYEITSRAASVDISIRLMNATGSLEVGDLKLSKLSFNEGYVKLQFATFIVWGLVLAWLIALALQYATRMQLIGILVLMALAFVGTLLPPKVISTASLLIADLLPDSLIDGSRGILAILYGHDALTPVAGEIRKIGHFLVFLVLGFLVGFGSKKIQLFFAAASISVFALVTEVLQTLIYGRSPSTVDFIVDCVGGVIGLGIGVFAYVIARLYTKANTQSV